MKLAIYFPFLLLAVAITTGLRNGQMDPLEDDSAENEFTNSAKEKHDSKRKCNKSSKDKPDDGEFILAKNPKESEKEFEDCEEDEIDEIDSADNEADPEKEASPVKEASLDKEPGPEEIASPEKEASPDKEPSPHKVAKPKKEANPDKESGKDKEVGPDKAAGRIDTDETEPLVSIGAPLRHGGGLCVGRVKDTPVLTLQTSCKQKFSFTPEGTILHLDSGLCLHAPQNANNGRVILSKDCKSPKSKFAATKKHSLTNVASNKCVHPHNGKLDSKPGTRLVLYHGCDMTRTAFKLDKIIVSLKHFGGLCAHFDTKLKHIILRKSCLEKFELTKNGNIIHIHTKKCVVPLGHKDNSFLGLTANCKSPNAVFKKTMHNSILHVATRKCIHPLLGKEKPQENRNLVIYKGCNEKRLAFLFVAK